MCNHGNATGSRESTSRTHCQSVLQIAVAEFQLTDRSTHSAYLKHGRSVGQCLFGVQQQRQIVGTCDFLIQLWAGGFDAMSQNLLTVQTQR